MKTCTAIIFIIMVAIIPFAAFAQRDSAGKKITYGKMNEGFLEDSRVSFSGSKTPKIIRFRWRDRDNSIINEYLTLQNNTSYNSRFSGVFTETAPSYYSDATAQYLKDEKDVNRRVRNWFKNMTWYSEMKEFENQDGNFSYIITGDSSESKDKCIYVRQGFNTATTTRAGTYYKSIVNFGFCAANTNEAELLEYYSSIRVTEE